MNSWAVAAIIIVVLAIIISNIMLLKRSANSQFSSHLSEANKPKKYEDDDGDSW